MNEKREYGTYRFCPLIKKRCKRDECAWWDMYNCSIQSIADTLTVIKDLKEAKAK